MNLRLAVTLPVIAASAIAQTTVYPNTAPRATAAVIAGSDAGAPSLRYWSGCATDDTRLFVFGGRGVTSAGNATSTYYNGLDAYDPGTNTWTNLSAEGAPTAPSNRFRVAMTFDPTANRIVIFGGRASATGAVFSDGYAFDLGSNTWSSIPNPTPGTTGPSARFDSKMAFDGSTGLLMLFGGQGSGGTTNRFGDTWLLAGNSWIPTTPASNPSARAIHAMAARSAPYFDVVMFGGRDTANARLDDTWRWDGGAMNWVPVTPANATVPVTFAGGNEAVYDSVRQVVSIIGGTGTGNTPSNTTGAGSWTSEYDCVTNVWRAFGNSLTSQSADDPLLGRQQRFPVAFVGGKTYFWGGQNPATLGDSNLAFVKEYQAAPLATSTPFGSGCNGSAGAMALMADNDPWSGRSWSLTGSGFPASSVGAMAIGLLTQSIAISSLHPAGGAGCNVLVSQDASLLVLPSGGQASASLTIPYTPAFAGLDLHTQMYGIELGGSGQITLITSTNAVTGSIGAL
ncbi:MAG: hypothetical protein NXI31_03140 [bacterium]|nr:hypothetical protein [bacterium]